MKNTIKQKTKKSLIFGTTNIKDFKTFLRREKFDYNGGDKDVDSYSTWFLGIHIQKKDNSVEISFGHSEDGYYNINNATFEQIKSIINIFKSAEFIGEDVKIPKKRFQLYILEILKKSISK